MALDGRAGKQDGNLPTLAQQNFIRARDATALPRQPQQQERLSGQKRTLKELLLDSAFDSCNVLFTFSPKRIKRQRAANTPFSLLSVYILVCVLVMSCLRVLRFLCCIIPPLKDQQNEISYAHLPNILRSRPACSQQARTIFCNHDAGTVLGTSTRPNLVYQGRH